MFAGGGCASTGSSRRSPPTASDDCPTTATARRDRIVKKAEYEDSGIESYWIDDPDHASITAYEFRDGRYAQVAHVEGHEIFETERPFPFSATRGTS